MNARILLLVSALAGFTSCATYRSGQTPDDVYYSPARETEEYVEVQRNDDRYSYNENRLEEQRMRQQIRDPRFRSFEDDFYWNSPRITTWNNPWNNPWNNSWNNPWNNPWNNFGWNNGFSWGGLNTWNTWGSPFHCIPGTNIVISKPGTGIKTSTGIRYSPSVQTFSNATNTPTSGGRNGKGIYSNGSGNSGSRFFGGAVNNSNNGRRSSGSIFSGSSGSGSSNRTFNSGGSSSGGGSRTFSSGGGSSSGGSSGGGSKSSGGTGGRRN